MIRVARYSLSALILLVVLAGSITLVSASSEKVSDPVQIYCARVIPKKAVTACAGTNNTYVNQARNAATYHCITAPVAGDQKALCIERQAKLLFRAVADKNPTSVKSFKAKFDAVINADIKATGGSRDTASPDSLAIKDPAKLTQPKTSIIPASLPKPPTNAGTISTILSWIFALLGAIALLMITAMGLKYMFAAGDPQSAAEARKGIIYALIGLVIAVSAEAIVVFLVNNV